ncbi:hypothetical protein PVW48_06845 [Dinoroseobacter sp. PD6]|uniref:hypothetical protein n=1 Tax=Dinoroseobacter sp. PD6 TaxID=3028384 RepID=UPI00237C4EB3|nr:hypothetical protein [Dinoroseobacter sp. PD6]MDD9716453.1 hypothetical protein [Dinoroseobacter sp. PD6]
MAKDMAGEAITTAMVPVCLSMAAADPARVEKTALVQEASTFNRSRVLMDTGWATLPGTDTLVAEVIEAGFKSLPSRAIKATASGRRIRPSRTTWLILALGVQDTDVQGLVMPVGTTFVGATSGHLVVVTQNALPRPGGEMRFQLNYSALMRAMAAPDVETVLRCDRPPTDASYAVADPVLAQH